MEIGVAMRMAAGLAHYNGHADGDCHVDRATTAKATVCRDPLDWPMAARRKPLTQTHTQTIRLNTGTLVCLADQLPLLNRLHPRRTTHAYAGSKEDAAENSKQPTEGDVGDLLMRPRFVDGD